jgi:hypothetical protein
MLYYNKGVKEMENKKFNTDKEIISFILENKLNQRKILINLGKDYFLIGATNSKGITRKLIDYTIEGNQIQIIFNEKKELIYLYRFNRKTNLQEIIFNNSNY